MALLGGKFESSHIWMAKFDRPNMAKFKFPSENRSTMARFVLFLHNFLASPFSPDGTTSPLYWVTLLISQTLNDVWPSDIHCISLPSVFLPSSVHSIRLRSLTTQRRSLLTEQRRKAPLKNRRSSSVRTFWLLGPRDSRRTLFYLHTSMVRDRLKGGP